MILQLRYGFTLQLTLKKRLDEEFGMKSDGEAPPIRFPFPPTRTNETHAEAEPVSKLSGLVSRRLHELPSSAAVPLVQVICLHERECERREEERGRERGPRR